MDPTPVEFDPNKLHEGEVLLSAETTKKIGNETAEKLASSSESPETLEPLTLEDLLFDGVRVRAVENLFPALVDGIKDQRIYVVEIPGEDRRAVVWYTNTQYGPEIVKLDRLADWSRGSFTTLDGFTHEYKKSPSCGCGNRLRTFRPWDGFVRIVQVSSKA